MSDVIAAITSALATNGVIVQAVSEQDWHRPTVCEGWTVHDVTNHLVGGMCIFTDELNGVPARADHARDWLGDNPARAYDAAASDDAAAWGRPHALDGTITIGLGTLPAPLAAIIHLTEVLVHGADVAVAIDREHLIDQDACIALLRAMEHMGGVDLYRVPGVFGAAVPVPARELPHRQLLGYLGRPVVIGDRAGVA